MRSDQTRQAFGFGLAAAAHVLVLVALRAAPDEPLRPRGIPTEAPGELHVEIEPAPILEAPPAAEGATSSAGSAVGYASAGRAPEKAVGRALTEVEPTPDPSTSEASATAPLVFTKPTAPSLVLAGVSGAGHEAPAAPGPFTSSAPRELSAKDAAERATALLRDGLHEHDAAIGLGPEGAVITALEAATHASTATDRGRASFIAVIDSGGLVELRLSKSLGPGWEDAKKRALAALAGKPFALRGAKRAEIEIEVVSDVRTPSGAKVPITPTQEASRVRRSENVPGGTLDTVQTHTVARFDLADIGARSTRVVHAKVVRASFF